jgi:hypothetical protein
MPRPLYPQGKSPWYPLDRRLGRPQSRSGRGGEEKNFQPPPGIELPSNNNYISSAKFYVPIIEYAMCEICSTPKDPSIGEVSFSFFVL